MEERISRVALTLVPGIGDVLGKKLVARCGSAEAVFSEKKKLLRKIPRIGETVIEALASKDVFRKAEKEIAFMDRYRIRMFFFRDKEYPFRLRNCYDSPLLLYYKGNADLNAGKILGIVGTRKATPYGKEICRSLTAGMAGQQVLVVSGLAFGIDACAHRAALDAGLPTVAVLGHGLDRIYPDLNRHLAEKMTGQGGLLTDFPSGTNPDRENFPRRNRIIAGLCDAIVVVEAGSKGGALITAEIANSYNRDVFAVPGRIGDPWSEGANALIRTNKAALIQSADDIRYMMGWDTPPGNKPPVQRKIFIEMTPEEEKIFAILNESGKTGIDELCIKAGIPMSRVSAALLNLEFEGVVRSLPGKQYELG
jgi:DNA processing protein